jgi:hypothetical protein
VGRGISLIRPFEGCCLHLTNFGVVFKNRSNKKEKGLFKLFENFTDAIPSFFSGLKGGGSPLALSNKMSKIK